DPAPRREDGRENDAHQIELRDRADGSDDEVPLETECLTGRDHDYYCDEDSGEADLPGREVDDTGGRRHGAARSLSPARKARRRPSVMVGAIPAVPSACLGGALAR